MGKKNTAKASNGAAPAADSSLHGETLKMIKVRLLSLLRFSDECLWLGLVGGLREETRTPSDARPDRPFTASVGSFV